MGLIALVLIVAGFLGTVLSFFNIAIHAYKEQGPLWGLLCLLAPGANVAWGVVHWSDDEARTLFVRYLVCGGMFALGLVINKAF